MKNEVRNKPLTGPYLMQTFRPSGFFSANYYGDQYLVKTKLITAFIYGKTNNY